MYLREKNQVSKIGICSKFSIGMTLLNPFFFIAILYS